jgi:hypothetical protein
MNVPSAHRSERSSMLCVLAAAGALVLPGIARAQTAALPDAPSTVLLTAAAEGDEGASWDGASAGSAPVSAETSSSIGMAEALMAQTETQLLAQNQIPAPAGARPAAGQQPGGSDRSNQTASKSLPDCPRGILSNFKFLSGRDQAYCQEQDPLQFIVEPGPIKPLSPSQKAFLAAKGVIDPFNLITIVAFSGISVAANAHSAYGPGLHGWGLLIGYSLVEDIQGETTGTFLLPVIFHEDPRYHRLPGHPIGQRILHAIGHTVLSQGDDGHIMPNYATLINYPLSAEISNLYVPGIATNGPSTVKRILVGYGTDPVGAIVAEFLPDVARRIHIHIVFAQQILNQIATGQGNAPL